MSTKTKPSSYQDSDLRPLPPADEDAFDTLARLEAEEDARWRAVGEIRFVGKLLRSGGHDARRIAQQYEMIEDRWLLPYECHELPRVRSLMHDEFPHAHAVIDELLAATFRNSGTGQPVIRLGPAVLVGAPGTGKSRLARRLCEHLGIAYRAVSVAGAHDDHILGVSRGWASATPSVILQLVAECERPNPVVILDEVEKPIVNHNSDLLGRLLPLLERSEAQRWREPLLGVDVDASAVGWIMTANSLHGIPAPLRSRIRVLNVPEPGAEHAAPLVRHVLDDLAAEAEMDPRWLAGYAPQLTDLLRPRLAEHRSVRVLRRQIEVALDALQEQMPRV